MDLIINTIEFGKVEFVLDSGRKKIKKTFPISPQESDKILIFLEEFFKKNKILKPQSEIKKIIIYKKNTGSFTGLRIAAAIAQALGLAWKIPIKVLNKKSG